VVTPIVAEDRMVTATVFTDPFCPWSWAAEPQLRRLQIEFGDSLGYTFVIVGLRRRIEPADAAALALDCLDAAAESGMPVDPRVFLRDPPSSTHPAGLAVAAVADQADPARFIRRLREAILLERRRMDTGAALLDAARETGGLDLERLKVDFASNAIVERFGADLERGRGVRTPAFSFGDGGSGVEGFGDGGSRVEGFGDGGSRVEGYGPYELVREAALAAGAAPVDDGFPGVEAALRRFGALATAEVAAACDLPGPRAPAELWRLALEWRIKPRRVPGGELWEVA
jgi:predicted DsbA family dithiol-disulfide isomerase